MLVMRYYERWAKVEHRLMNLNMFPEDVAER